MRMMAPLEKVFERLAGSGLPSVLLHVLPATVYPKGRASTRQKSTVSFVGRRTALLG